MIGRLVTPHAMLQRRPRLSAVRCAAIGAVVCVCAFTTHASAAPDGHREARGADAAAESSTKAPHRSRALADEPYPHKVVLGPDGLPNDPYIGVYNGWAGLTTTLYIGKLKLAVRIPQLVAAVYAFGSSDNGFKPAPSWALPADAKPNCGYWFGYNPGNVYLASVEQPDKTKPGRVVSVGQVPDTKVHALIFGSIPVSATLHIRQQGKPGELTPITAREIVQKSTYYKPFNPNTDNADDAVNCDNDWSGNFPGVVVAQAVLTASISDVKIDGKAVDVGDHCVTSAPTELRANGNNDANGGHYAGLLNGGTLTQQLNRTTTEGSKRVKLFPGAINLSIAPFVGCRDKSGNQDLSPLLNTFIAGSDNTASLFQGYPILNNSPGTDKTDICGDDGTGRSNIICADDPLPYAPAVAPGK